MKYFIYILMFYMLACSEGGNQRITPDQLNGTWELNYLDIENSEFDSLFPDKKPVLMFALPADIVSGTTGCNSLQVLFEMQGHHVRFENPKHGKDFCTGSGEQLFIQILQDVKRINLESGALAFYKDDSLRMRFSRQLLE